MRHMTSEQGRSESKHTDAGASGSDRPPPHHHHRTPRRRPVGCECDALSFPALACDEAYTTG